MDSSSWVLSALDSRLLPVVATAGETAEEAERKGDEGC